MCVPRLPALAAFLSMVALAACEPGIGGTEGTYRPTEDACGAAGLQMLVGQPLSSLTAMSLDQPVRLIRPDQVMTLEYQENRLSVAVDDSGRITRLSCG